MSVGFANGSRAAVDAPPAGKVLAVSRVLVRTRVRLVVRALFCLVQRFARRLHGNRDRVNIAPTGEMNGIISAGAH